MGTFEVSLCTSGSCHCSDSFCPSRSSDKVEKISSVKVNDLAAIVETKVAESAGDTTKPADVKYVPLKSASG